VLRDQTLELLQKHGLSAEAALDEQQLVDPKVITVMIEASDLNSSDTVLEIGPGAGNITIELAKKAKKVYAIEKNPKFLSLLKERLTGSGVEVILGDALTTFLPSFDVLISNLPYAIVEAMLQRLKRLRFRAASLIVPSTFANTITAQKGEFNYSKLSLETHLYFDLSMVSFVKSVSYYPEPKTETVIVVLKPKEAKGPTEAVVWHLLKQGDKKVLNALREAFISSSAKGYPSTKRTAKEAVGVLGLDKSILEKRVAALSLADIELIFGRLEHNAA
jgi:16S rRNA (adenine1518-N6/adenine1519-N6)-dimethyltransferase